MMKNIVFILICTLFLSAKLQAQDLNIDVTINTPKLNIADPKVFTSLEQAIKDFFNNTNWTDDQFEPQERIEGSVQINIKEDLTTNSFIGDFYVSTSRPVYNSNYYTPTLLHVDRDVNFFYEQFNPLFNNTSSFSDNLSAILTYYAYVILGFDYDTFSPLGGEQFFNIAKNIVSSVPPNISNSDKSWVAIGSTRNRYWLVENMLNPRVKAFRQAIYDYHRNSLDSMHDNVERSRAVMLSALTSISMVDKSYPNSMILKLFSDAKRDEIVEIFNEGSKGEKDKVYKIMTDIDPALASEFNSLKGGRN